MNHRVAARIVCAVVAATLALTACDRRSDHASRSCASGIGSEAFVDAAHLALPSVVAVLSEGTPDRRDPTAVPVSLGSGVAVMRDGIILTSNHVVAGGRKIYVATQDGSHYEAQVVGADPP